MTDFNSVQRETINHWRQARGFGILEMPDEKAASIMLQEMKDSGTVYPGFESLLRNASTPSPSLYSTNTSPSLFGWGAKENVGHQSNYAYDMAITHLEGMTNSAQRNMDIQALRQGVISGAAAWDLFKNVFDMEYSSGNVNKAISDSRNDIERLKLASTGQLYNCFDSPIDFEEAFYNLRGVKFNLNKIRKCDTNAKSLAQARTTKKIFDEVKAKLNSASISALNTIGTQGSALEDVFKILCTNENGVLNGSAINDILASIEAKNEGHPALKYGTDLKLERNDKGEYEFRVTTQNGERNPITAEHLDMLKGSLTEMLDTMMAIQLGIEFDSNTPIEDVRRLTSEEMVKREADYKESFSEAYGKKDLNELSEEFVQGQMTADMVAEGIVNIGSMALMLTGSGVLVKGAQWTSKMLSAKHAAKVAEIAQKATTAAQKATPVLVGVQVTQPVKALDLVSSEATWKGLAGSLKEALGIELTEEEITAQSIALEKLTTYGMTVAEASAWMMLGMASGAVGDKARLFLKQKGLANIVKNSGKSINNLMDMYKSGKITGDLAKTLSRMEQIATMSGNGLEFGVDVLLTYAGNQALHGEGLTLNDLLMSMNGVLIGSAMQKQMLNKPYEARLEDFRTQIKNNDPSISDKDLDIRAKTLLELSKLAESKQPNPSTTSEKANDTSNNDAILAQARKKIAEQLRNGEKVSGTKASDAVNPTRTGTVDEFGQIHRGKAPKGYIIDSKTNELIKVDINKAIIECTSNRISLEDERGNVLGNVSIDGTKQLQDGTNALIFQGLISNVDGAGVGTMLIEELVKASEARGCNGQLIAVASPMRADKVTNLGFYYKMGFEATDAQKHQMISDCIANNKEIPLELNYDTEIVYRPNRDSSKPIKNNNQDTLLANNTTHINQASKGVLLDEDEVINILKENNISEKGIKSILARLINENDNFNKEVIDSVIELKNNGVEENNAISILREIVANFNEDTREIEFKIPDIKDLNNFIDVIISSKKSGCEDTAIFRVLAATKDKNNKINQDLLLNPQNFQKLMDFYLQYKDSKLFCQSQIIFRQIVNQLMLDNSGQLNDTNIKFIKEVLDTTPMQIGILTLAKDKNGVFYPNTKELIDYAQARKNVLEESEIRRNIKYLKDKNGRLDLSKESLLINVCNNLKENNIKPDEIRYLANEEDALDFNNLEKQIETLINLHKTWDDGRGAFTRNTTILLDSIEAKSNIEKVNTLQTITSWVTNDNANPYYIDTLIKQQKSITPKQISVINNIKSEFGKEALNLLRACTRDNCEDFYSTFKDMINTGFDKNRIVEVLQYYPKSPEITKQLCLNKDLDFPKDKIKEILQNITNDNEDFILQVLADNTLLTILKENLNLQDKNLSISDIFANLEIQYIRNKSGNANPADNEALLTCIKKLNERFIPRSDFFRFLEENNSMTQKEMVEITEKLIQLRRHTNVKLESVLGNLQGNNSAEKLELLLKALESAELEAYETKALIDNICNNKTNIVTDEQLEAISNILKEYKKEERSFEFFKNTLDNCLDPSSLNKYIEFVNKIQNTTLSKNERSNIIKEVNKDNSEVYSKLVFENLDVFSVREINDIVKNSNSYEDLTIKILDACKTQNVNTKITSKVISQLKQKNYEILRDDVVLQEFIKNLKNTPVITTKISDSKYVIIKCQEKDSKDIVLKMDTNKGTQIIAEEKKFAQKGIAEIEYTSKNSQIRIERYAGLPGIDPTGLLETIKDLDGNMITRTITKPSKTNPEVLVTLREIYDKSGNVVEVKEIGTVKNYGTNKQGRKIEKDFISPDGTSSKQTIIEGPLGKYTRFETDGNVFERRFRKLDENSTKTVVNNNTYECKFNSGNIEITRTDSTGKTSSVTIPNTQIDSSLENLFKQLPGDFLYIIAKKGIKIGIDQMRSNNAFYSPAAKQIGISKELINDPFSFAHEFGHMLDDEVFKGLNSDANLKDIFAKELEAYNSQSTDFKDLEIGYFIAEDHVNTEGCLTEVIAEANAIISGLQHDKNFLLLRAKLLQENFPKTLAYIADKLSSAADLI